MFFRLRPILGPMSKITCGIIMKGGVSSGVLYPAMLADLAQTHTFAEIGGTSAGAIAAAVLAACQYRANSDPKCPYPFDVLKQINQEFLDSPTLLSQLFKPDFESQETFDLLMCLKKRGDLKRREADRRSHAPVAPPVFWGGLRSGWSEFLLRRKAQWQEFRLVSPELLSLVKAVRQLSSLSSRQFGICTGLELSTWLHDRLEAASGIKVLTFGDLKNSKTDLRMVVTNLGEQEPLVLPNRSNEYCCKIEDLKSFFPPMVVAHLTGITGSLVMGGHQLPAGYCRFPLGDEMPVLVATRLSLSVPVLFRSFPAYQVRWPEVPKDFKVPISDIWMDRCWLVDGGISSNFPVHFFDHWMPEHPIFALKFLYTKPPKGQSVRSYTAEQKRKADYSDQSHLLDFLKAIFYVAKDYRDNQHSRLAGFRDRVVDVHLDDDEGGFNLDMGETAIRSLQGKGRLAAAEFQKLDWDEHQWMRLRILAQELHAQFDGLRGLNDLTSSPKHYQHLDDTIAMKELVKALSNLPTLAQFQKQVETVDVPGLAFRYRE